MLDLKLVGGSSPNSDFLFFLEILCFFRVFFFVVHVSKKNKKLDRQVGGIGILDNPSFSRIFFNLTRPLTEFAHSILRALPYIKDNIDTHTSTEFHI